MVRQNHSRMPKIISERQGGRSHIFLFRICAVTNEKVWRQRIEVRPNGEASKVGVSLFVFGIRYIDDIVLRVRVRDANASGPPEERRYYLTDANYNVVMRVDDAGHGIERMFYSSYGQPECFPFGDVDTFM